MIAKKTTLRRIFIEGIVILTLLLNPTPGLTQSGGPYDLSWYTIEGGGGTSSGGNYSLAGTAGQSDPNLLAGGNFTLAGGYWRGGIWNNAVPYSLYLPLVMRNR